MLPPLLRENANFRRYFIGQAVSLVGDQITLIALPLTAVLALDASAGQMGALTTIALVPNLIFSLHAGSWVDRRAGRRKVMLVTDVVMPGMSGPDVAVAVAAMRPGAHVLYISGYTDSSVGHPGSLDPGTAFLQKPFSADVLTRAVREVLDDAAVPVD